MRAGLAGIGQGERSHLDRIGPPRLHQILRAAPAAKPHDQPAVDEDPGHHESLQHPPPHRPQRHTGTQAGDGAAEEGLDRAEAQPDGDPETGGKPGADGEENEDPESAEAEPAEEPGQEIEEPEGQDHTEAEEGGEQEGEEDAGRNVEKRRADPGLKPDAFDSCAHRGRDQNPPGRTAPHPWPRKEGLPTTGPPRAFHHGSPPSQRIKCLGRIDDDDGKRFPRDATMPPRNARRPMLTGDLKNQIDRIWDAFWSGGISNPLEVIEQITYLLFLRRLDDLQTLEENKATRLKRPLERHIFPEGKDPKKRPYADLRWSRFKHFAAAEMFTVVDQHVFPFLRTLGGDTSTYAHHMKDARFTIPKPALLVKVVELLDAVPLDDRDTKGDLYE